MSYEQGHADGYKEGYESGEKKTRLALDYEKRRLQERLDSITTHLLALLIANGGDVPISEEYRKEAERVLEVSKVPWEGYFIHPSYKSPVGDPELPSRMQLRMQHRREQQIVNDETDLELADRLILEYTDPANSEVLHFNHESPEGGET